jgi:aspartate racemase
MIGVMGGMGPLATADFLNKVIEETHATVDEEHVPLLISCDPRIPPRPPAILAGGESPLPRLLEIRDRLLKAGATALVMPCNTAHYWYAELTADCPVPFLSIVETSCREALRIAGKGDCVGIAGTRATLAARLFDRVLEDFGLSSLTPTEDELEQSLLPAIAAVKAGELREAASLARESLEAMAKRGAGHVLLACTELPIALAAADRQPSVICIDTTRVLARATVEYWRANHESQLRKIVHA